MKAWITAVSFFAIWGCSQEAPKTTQGANEPAAAGAPVGVKSQWLLIAHTDGKGGGIFIDPTLKRVDPETGFSDVTLKVSHGDVSTLDATPGDAATLYREEKVTFRFNCPKKTYVLVRREAINKNGDVIATTAPDITSASYREVAPGGVASVAQGQACPQG